MTDNNLEQLVKQSEKVLHTPSKEHKKNKLLSWMFGKLNIKIVLVLVIVISLNHVANSLGMKFIGT